MSFLETTSHKAILQYKSELEYNNFSGLAKPSNCNYGLVLYNIFNFIIYLRLFPVITQYTLNTVP